MLLGWLAFVVVGLFQLCPMAYAAPVSAVSMPATGPCFGVAGMSHKTSVPACCVPGHREVYAAQCMTRDAGTALPGSAVAALLHGVPMPGVRLPPSQTQPPSRAAVFLRTPRSVPLYLHHGRFLI